MKKHIHSIIFLLVVVIVPVCFMVLASVGLEDEAMHILAAM